MQDSISWMSGFDCALPLSVPVFAVRVSGAVTVPAMILDHSGITTPCAVTWTLNGCATRMRVNPTTVTNVSGFRRMVPESRSRCGRSQFYPSSDHTPAPELRSIVMWEFTVNV